MILCNVELKKALDEGHLVIDPEPLPRRPARKQKSPYDTHSVDLRLGDDILVPRAGQFAWNLSRPGKVSEFAGRNARRVRITPDQPFSLRPQLLVLGMTRERISLPIREGDSTGLAARIEGKSSRARCGLLIHFTAPTIHPGFEGNITLEMINLGEVDFLLVPGMAIAQLIVEEVKGIPFRTESQFQGQRTPEGL